MRVLAVDSAVGRCSATIVADEQILAGQYQDTDRGQTSLLPMMVDACLREAGFAAPDLDLIAVTVGPGSFTGIRGCLALAQGLAIAAGCPAVGVTVGEALADALSLPGGRRLWCATTSRRGRVFLEIGETILSCATDALPTPDGPVALAGGAAGDVASRLAARGFNVMLTAARLPEGLSIARVGARRLAGLIPPRAAEPLYVDPPEAKPQAPRQADR